jgi:hypothetical protein
MTCNITSTPILPEPLPLYQPRNADPETASVISAAPSYISEAPTYVSNRQSTIIVTTPPRQSTSLLPPHRPEQRTIGLPAAEFAEGFQGRGNCNVANVFSHSNYTIRSWSSISTGQNARQYQNVAARRASKVSASPLFNSLTSSGPPELAAVQFTEGASGSTPSSSIAASMSLSPPSAFPTDMELAPIHPLEDPYLVGESAAAQARQQRIYREMCLRKEEAIKNEGQSWDFLLAQMGDWDERHRSWARFRQEIGTSRTKLLNRRIGFRL